jgi:hypothetical protein
VVERLYSLVAGGAGPGRVRRFYLAYADGLQLARHLEPGPALDAVNSDLCLFLAERARGRVFVHAGAVAWRGRALIVPGRSFAGKSCLVATLVAAGATYYSDEYAVLDPAGRVHPFPTRLSLRPGFAPPPLGALRAGTRPVAVGLVVVSQHRAGARARLRRLSRGRAVLALLQNTVPARRRPAEALRTLRKVAAQAPAFQGVRGEASEIAARLLDRLERR